MDRNMPNVHKNCIYPSDSLPVEAGLSPQDSKAVKRCQQAGYYPLFINILKTDSIGLPISTTG